MRISKPLLLSALTVASASLLPTSASAQEAQNGEFSVQRFAPAPGPGNYLSVEGARMDTEMGWSAGLFFNYSRDPFVVVSCQSVDNCDDPNALNRENVSVIQDMFTWDLMGSFQPIKILQLGLRVPLSYVSGNGINVETGGPSAEGISSFGLGDPTLEGKIRFYGDPKELFVLAAALDVAFPLGHATAENSYIGNDSPVAIGLRGIFDGKSGPITFGLNLKGTYRGENTLGSTTVGPVEFGYGVGAGYQISPLLQVLAEGFGGTQFKSENGTNTLEIDGAVRVTPLDTGIAITGGGGVGVIEGVGVPVARGIVGVMYSHEVGDKDGDGLYDNVDECPTEPEDRDQFEDEDGCPDDDNDRDRVLDIDDKCPMDPETINGLEDEDGCPDEVKDTDADGIPDEKDKCPEQPGKVRTPEFYGCADTDKDGVPDPKDKCITEPEDTDGFEDLDGCPDPDNDQDGVLDNADECVDEPEIMNGFEDEDGCPDSLPDADNDGIPDRDDKCPKRPETLNGIKDEDGCPDAGVSLVEVGAEEIKILQRVEFATGSDKIQGQTSFRVLGAVASAMKNNPSIFLIEIAGHTDNVGNSDLNKKLSQQRAEAVVEFLEGQGVKGNRLKAVGHGQEKPIADNKNTQGRQKNRRVEFNILKSSKKK